MKQYEPFTTFVKLMSEMDTAEFERIRADSSDWDTVSSAIADAIMGSLILMSMGETQKAIESLVLMAQIVYSNGYRRGKAEKTMPVFMVKEEE